MDPERARDPSKRPRPGDLTENRRWELRNGGRKSPTPRLVPDPAASQRMEENRRAQCHNGVMPRVKAVGPDE